MKRISAAVLVLFLWAGLVHGQTADPSASKQLFVQIDEMLRELGTISGLKPLHAIEYDLITRPQIRQFLDERIQEEIKPEELRAQELALKKFGFVPQDFDLKKMMVDRQV